MNKKTWYSLFLVGVLFTLYLTTYGAVVDQYFFKPTTSYWEGSLKNAFFDTDGRIHTTNTSDVENIVDYMRRTSTALDSSATPTVANQTHFTVGLTQPSMTNFTNGVEGQTIYIKNTLDSCFYTDGATLDVGSVDITADTNSVMVLRLYGSVWTIVSFTNPNTDNN